MRTLVEPCVTCGAGLRVGDRQLRPFGLDAVAAGAVGRGQVAGEGGQRPAVGRDVMDDHRESMIVVGGSDEARTDGDLGGQIEGERGEVAVRALGDVTGREDRQVDVDRVRVDRGDARHTVDLGDDAAQRLVSPDDVDQGRPECVGVECADEADGERHVVGRRGRGVQPCREPQPMLGRGQRHGSGDGPPGGVVGGDRGGADGRLIGVDAQVGQGRDEAGEVVGVEHRTDPDPMAGGAGQPRGHPCR